MRRVVWIQKLLELNSVAGRIALVRPLENVKE